MKSKQNAKFSDFLDENRLIFVVLSGRFQNLFLKKERFWRLVVTATITVLFKIIEAVRTRILTLIVDI